MANYANKRSQELEKWQENLKLAKDFRKKVADYEKWKDWKYYYRNDYAPGVIPVNLIFSIGRSIIPRVYFRNPQVSVIPLNRVWKCKLELSRLLIIGWFAGLDLSKQ